MEPESKYKKIFLNTTTSLALATLLGYMYVYLYNAGYNDFFHIPQQMMSFSMPAVLGSIIALISAVALMWSYSMGVTIKKEHYRNAPDNILLLNISVMIFVTVLLFSFGAKWNDAGVLSVIVFTLTYIYIFFLHPLFSHRDVEGYFNKVNESIKRKMAKTETIGDYFFSAPVYLPFVFLIALIGSLLVAFYDGRRDASNQADFYIVNSDKQWVVAKYIDNDAILVKQNNRRMSGSYKVVDLVSADLSKENELIFTKVNIGKLHD
jgi:hypothetical protein